MESAIAAIRKRLRPTETVVRTSPLASWEANPSEEGEQKLDSWIELSDPDDLKEVTRRLATERNLQDGGFFKHHAIFNANQALVKHRVALGVDSSCVQFEDGDDSNSTAGKVAQLIKEQQRVGDGIISVSESWTDEALRYLRRVKYPEDNDVKLAALNYANCEYIGGNYSDGGMVKAQEEQLCRQFPALFESMKRSEAGFVERGRDNIVFYGAHVFGARFGDGYSKARNVLFTDEVECMRSSFELQFRLYYDNANRVKSGFVEAAAPLFGRYHDKDFQKWREEPHEWYEKIFLNVFWAPKSKDPNYDVIVVGPFGCGAFQNDPNVVARSFLNVIEKYDILKLYREVHFCLGRSIPNDDTVGGACNQNVAAFRTELSRHAYDDYTIDLQARAKEWLEDEYQLGGA